MYEDIIINCFRYLGFKSLYDIEILEFHEYALRMRAFNLSEVDKKYYMHLQAWLNHQVTATEERGKKQVPVFKSFKQFFDFEKELKEIEGEKVKQITDKHRKAARYAALINSLK